MVGPKRTYILLGTRIDRIGHEIKLAFARVKKLWQQNLSCNSFRGWVCILSRAQEKER